jgi:O-antigen/teichoic acid export membrane protein
MFSSKVTWFASAPAFGAMISFASLPFLTHYLGPRDYGIFALYSIVASFVGAAANPGALSYLSGKVKENSNLNNEFFSIFICGMVAGFFSTLLIFLASIAGARLIDISITSLFLACIAQYISLPWLLSMDYLVVKGDAKPFALVSIASATFSPLCSYTWLMFGGAAELALFVGAICASLVQALGATCIIGKLEYKKFDLHVFFELKAFWIATFLNRLLEWVYGVFERTVASSLLGFYALGLLSHSQQYRTVVNTLCKVVIRAYWSTSLEEAVIRPPLFVKSRRIWRLVDYFVLSLALIFAAFGQYFINLLTNNKFGDAGLFACGWMVMLIIQNASRPAMFIFHATLKGKFVSNASSLSLLVGLVFLYPLSLYFGPWGIILGGIMCSFANYVFLKYFLRF